MLLAGAVLLACGRPAAVAPPPVTPVPVTPDVARPTVDAPYGRAGLRPVPAPPSLERAIAAGTRSPDGAPGPEYWQQRVDYRIQAELDPVTARLTGQQTVTYHNRSPETLTVLVFRLHQNLFRPGEMRTRRVPVTDGMTIERVVVDGVEAQRTSFAGAPGPGVRYTFDGSTVMHVRLPNPLPPGDSSSVELAWHFTVPPANAPRTGHINHRLFTVAQWYPQVAVFDDLRGWHTDPYLGNAEFYLEYGDFHVSLTLPEGWLVAATGELINGPEVLTAPVLERLELAAAVDTVVRVVAPEDRGAGAATQRAPGGQLTWEFRAERVRDFAFATSNEYVWDASRAAAGVGAGRPAYVPVHALYRPEIASWRRAAEFTRHATAFHAARWAPYPYPQITMVEGPVGGMEYPMLIFVGGFTDARTLYEVTNHEVAHQWYPMLVGSNETAYAWQDEGLATYAEHLATMDFFPSARPFDAELASYLRVAGTEDETPLMRHADLHGRYESFVVAAYVKPALLLRALSGVVGPDTLHRALAEYTREWSFRHPSPHDFFRTVDRVAGRRLDWFWYPWWYETGVLDQGLVAVRPMDAPAGERVAITVEDRGDNPMPVLLALTTVDGEIHRMRVPVDVWFTGERQHTAVVDLPAPVAEVAIDPDRWFPDVDRSDHVWRRPDAGR